MGTGNEALLTSWTLSLHGKSPKTRELYLRCVGWFAQWLEANDRPADAPGDLLAVTRQDAEAWFGAQRDAGLAAATLRSRWIALRNLYAWLLDEDEIDANPMARVRVEKANPEPVNVLGDDDLRALLKACEGKGFLERRDFALIRSLAATGLRVSELCNLDMGDLDLGRRVFYVRHGKGDRARWVRFDTDTARALDRYVRARGRHRLADKPALWLTRSGRIQPQSVQYALERRAQAAGIGHVHPHMLRHTFAHRFLERGGTEGDLQRLGGWESAEVMRRYGAARAVDRALAAYDHVDPMEGL